MTSEAGRACAMTRRGPDDKGLPVPLCRPLSPCRSHVALGVLDRPERPQAGAEAPTRENNLTASREPTCEAVVRDRCGLSATWEPGPGALDALFMTQVEGWHSGGRGECLRNWDKVRDRLSPRE